MVMPPVSRSDQVVVFVYVEHLIEAEKASFCFGTEMGSNIEIRIETNPQKPVTTVVRTER